MSSASPSLTPLVAIVGPTAAGKSALGIFLARRLGGEVVVCDSTQVYRGFTIGTAKVLPAEQQGIPHHLMDIVEPGEIFTAGEFRRRALEVLEDLRRRGRLPILTVGTGLYFRALVEGLADAPTRSEELRARLAARADRRGSAYLHRLLARLDPAAAARIAPADRPKIIRAIEVCLLSGRPMSEVLGAGRPRLEGFAVTRIGLAPPRRALYERIERRAEAMLAAGWPEEVRALVAAGLPASAKPFQFIGYRELREHIEGKRTLGEALEVIQRATRRYAKRQLTWFRAEPGVRWFEGFGDDPAIAAAVLEYLEKQPGAAGRSATGV